MPTARQSLLHATHTALAGRPWPLIRMVGVAAAAGVSRQTLYNEFGSKDGLGAALVADRLEAFLGRTADTVHAAVRTAPAARADGSASPAGACAAGCAAAAAWMVRAARSEPLVRAALTGCWGPRLPPPGVPPDRLAALLHERVATAVAAALPPSGAALHGVCELGLRLALSYVVVPAGGPAGGADAVGERAAGVVRALLA